MMSFSSKLYYILEDIQKHKHSKSDVYEKYVQDRLDKALEQYIKQTEISVRYISSKDAVNVLKKLNRE